MNRTPIPVSEAPARIAFDREELLELLAPIAMARLGVSNETHFAEFSVQYDCDDEAESLTVTAWRHATKKRKAVRSMPAPKPPLKTLSADVAAKLAAEIAALPEEGSL